MTNTLPAALTDRLFTGQRAEPTGLYDYRSRMYDPVTGSFIQPDSLLGGIAGFNRYGYVGGNPVNYTDPTGHFGCPAPWDCLDIIDFGASLNGFIADPTLGNLGWLTLSTVGLLPIIPGLGMVRRAGKLGAVDNVAKTTRASGKLVPGFTDDELIYIHKALKGELDELIPTVECYAAALCRKTALGGAFISPTQDPRTGKYFLSGDPRFKYQGELGTNLQLQGLQPGDLLVYTKPSNLGYIEVMGKIRPVPVHANRFLGYSDEGLIFFDKGNLYKPFSTTTLKDTLNAWNPDIIDVYRPR